MKIKTTSTLYIFISVHTLHTIPVRQQSGEAMQTHFSHFRNTTGHTTNRLYGSSDKLFVTIVNICLSTQQ